MDRPTSTFQKTKALSKSKTLGFTSTLTVLAAVRPLGGRDCFAAGVNPALAFDLWGLWGQFSTVIYVACVQ